MIALINILKHEVLNVNQNRWKTKDVVVTAMISVVVGLLFTGLDTIYMPLSSLLGTVFVEVLFGIYCFSPMLPFYIIRKPGIALLGGVIAALINILSGSPYGIHILVAGVLEGIACEIVFMTRKYHTFNFGMLAIAGALAAIFITIRDCIVFGLIKMPAPIIAGTIAVRLVSAVFVGALLVTLICKAIAKTGVLKNFAISDQD